jgi:hypothetical protein
MKTIPCSLGLILLMNYTIAQKASFGITAGASFASIKVSAESVSATTGTHTGFTIGLVSSLPIAKDLSFRPQLNFVQKGGKTSSDGSSDHVTLNYIELPLNFVFNTPNPRGMFFIGAGPSLSMGLSGKDKWEDGTGSGSDDIKFGNSEDDDFKSFEAGINILAGYQFAPGFFVSANYNAGLSNITAGGSDPKTHNQYFGIGIGYMFSNKPKTHPQNSN